MNGVKVAVGLAVAGAGVVLAALVVGKAPQPSVANQAARPDRALPAIPSIAAGVPVVDKADPIVTPRVATTAPVIVASPLATGWGPTPAPDLDPRPFSEAHWQGLETVPRTQALIESLGLPADVEGVIVDDVTLPADLQGFRAGDLVTAVGGMPTPNLVRFLEAADRVRDDKRVAIDVTRAGTPKRIELAALLDRLGNANGETPPMIPPGARSPHPYQGPCLTCHRIGATGTLPTDQGDPLLGPPPPIRAGPSPHRDRGPCASCHRILP